MYIVSIIIDKKNLDSPESVGCGFNSIQALVYLTKEEAIEQASKFVQKKGESYDIFKLVAEVNPPPVNIVEIKD